MARRIATAVFAVLVALYATPLIAQAPDARAPARARPTKAPPGLKLDWKASGKQGVVAAGGAESVEAGLAMLRSGGNAADAAAATLLALTVTDAQLFCFGGEVPILVYDAKHPGAVQVICGQGEAPRLATREYFERLGGIPASGIEPAAVPGALDAIVVLLDRFGTKTFAEAVAPALKILDRNDQPWHADLARTIRLLTEAEQSARGDRARGLRLVSDTFYRGPVARQIDVWARQSGSLLRYSDLATHAARIEDPVSATYRGFTVYKPGPWTQGPCLLQSLQLLEGFDLKTLTPGGADAIHLQAEALKLALADRDFYYADPLFEDVPLSALFAPPYVEARRKLIDPRHASLDYRPGDPRAAKALLDHPDVKVGARGPAFDTTTCLAADASGNVVAATPSGWSGVLAGRTGVWLGSRLQSFNTWPGHINCIEPGKRPRVTLTPTRFTCRPRR
jgi:gamma-glutamyltranspeptidase/glutathione hydrolase